jgi:signal transduction histidine kinase/ligand-binding sensor domain-containing protein
LKKNIYLLFILLISITQLYGQSSRTLTFEWKGKKEGMPGLEIMDLSIDKQGIMWMATNDGLYRWNGIDLDKIVHEKNNKNSISGNYIFEIDELKDGRLYFSTNKGISILNTVNNNWQNIYVPIENNVNYCNHSRLINDSTIVSLFGYYGICILNINQLKCTIFKTKAVDESLKYLKSSTVDNNNNLWVACTGGLLKINLSNNKTETFKPRETSGKSGFDNIINDVCYDPEYPGKIWCATWGGGFKVLDEKTKTFQSYYVEDTLLPQNVYNIIHRILRVKGNEIMVSTTAGIKTFDCAKRTFSDIHLKKENGSIIPIINGYKVISDSTIIVYNFEGWGKTVHQHFEFIPKSVNSDGATYVWNTKSTSEDLEKISIYANRVYKRINLNNGKIIDSIRLPLLDKTFSETNSFYHIGKGLILSTSNGLFFLNLITGKTNAINISDHTLPLEELKKINDAHLVNDSTIIITSISGNAFKLNFHLAEGEIKEIYKTRKFIIGKNIQKTAQPKTDLIYYVGDNIYQYNPQTDQLKKILQLFKIDNRETITSFYSADEEVFWIGFEQNGCKKFFRQNNQYSYYHIGPDKDHPTTYFALTSDKENGMWGITYDGLVRIASNYKITYYNKQIELLNVRNSDDIQTLADGRIWINNYPGQIEIVTNNIDYNYSNLNIEIRDLRSSGKSIKIDPAKNEVVLNPGQTDLSFYLSAIQTDFASKINYKFRLINHDNLWKDLGNNRYVNITNLEPGNYRLEISAYDPESILKPANKIIELNVLPSFFQRRIVQIFLTIIILTILIISIKYLATKRLTLELAALQTQNELDQMRNSISRDIHDELGANITRITLATELLRRQDKNSNEFIEQLKKLGTLSKNLGKSLGEIVWSVNPQQNKSEYLILFIKQYLNEINEDSEINIQFNHTEIGKNITITPKAQRNVFLVIKEAVNNALKYSNATNIQVTLELNTESNHIGINIEDNGQGFNLDELRPYSNGITNMKTRCRELNLRFNIKSEINNGTMVTIEGDLSKIEQTFY